MRAAALGPRESRELFGVDLSGHGIQPVWLEIENGSNQRHIFLQQSVDSGYFAPREAAYRSRFSPTKRFVGYGLLGVFLWPLAVIAPVQAVSAAYANERMENLFVERGIGNTVMEPGDRHAGFVFTGLDAGTKRVDVTLLHPDGGERFRLFVQAPGLRADHAGLDPDTLYPETRIPSLDWPALRDAHAGHGAPRVSHRRRP